MIHFIKYTAPSWYFNLHSKKEFPYYVDIDKFDSDSTDITSYLSQTNAYSNHRSQKIDYAHQLFLKGFICDQKNTILTFDEKQIPVKDSYLFIRRFYHPAWLFIVFFFRILEFKNPFTELNALIKSLKHVRINVHKPHFINSFEQYPFPLLKQQPKVSVIIPTLNRYQYLKDVLTDLEKQDYKNFEVLVVDQSDPYDSDFYTGWKLDLTVWNQQEKALWLARNTAIQKASGSYILLYDDDSLVDEYWITNHLKCLDFFNCEISSGASISVIGGKVPEHYSYFRWGDQIDTGNVMIKREVFEQIGLFDRQFEKQRQGDGEFGLRAYLLGFKNISNPLAKRVHLKVKEGGLREMGSWDGWRPKNFFAPRPIPSVLYFTRTYFGNAAALREIAISAPLSIVPYRFKRNNRTMVIGVLLGLVTLPIIVVSVIRSWRLSSIKLKQGPKTALLQS